jgi:ABC-type uncharacterized transport system permease subunit
MRCCKKTPDCQAGATILELALLVDRYLLIVSSFCFFAAIVRTILSLRARTFQPGRFSFLTIGLGFIFKRAFLSLRGHELHRCPLTNLFEVFIFLAWSIALIYMLVGPTYRLSLMGAFTAPLVFLLQAFALIAPIDVRHASKAPANSWLEFHASTSIIAYGAFGLACIAGVMYLVQERQLKTHHLHSIFYHLPPLTDLFAAITRLLWWGFRALYPRRRERVFYRRTAAAGSTGSRYWGLAALCSHLAGSHLRRLAPKRVAALCILGFTAALTLLWGSTFSAQTHSMR